jgi:hypothetical protein
MEMPGGPLVTLLRLDGNSSPAPELYDRAWADIQLRLIAG